jgi:hypothetical protein
MQKWYNFKLQINHKISLPLLTYGGYPLVTVAGSFSYYTAKGVPNQGEGPVNTINFARTLSNTSWVQYVSPNVNVLYGNAWLDLTKGPVVLTIPPIPHRYYVMQFMDSFGLQVCWSALHRSFRRSLSYCWSRLEWTGSKWNDSNKDFNVPYMDIK